VRSRRRRRLFGALRLEDQGLGGIDAGVASIGVGERAVLAGAVATYRVGADELGADRDLHGLADVRTGGGFLEVMPRNRSHCRPGKRSPVPEVSTSYGSHSVNHEAESHSGVAQLTGGKTEGNRTVSPFVESLEGTKVQASGQMSSG
jgi:hypothetical protein